MGATGVATVSTVAAGTVALVDMKRGLRASLYTQYMPSEAYPVHRDFPNAVLADLKAMKA